MQDLTSASVSQAGARLWTIEYEGYYSRVRFALLQCRDTPQVGAHGATWALTVNSASVSQAIDGLVGQGQQQGDNCLV